ncbi:MULTISPECIES: hypothetical protein [unclassified Sphingopyxis]|uniref:hypothetical protein n=1 Tax=unclassified Sphingopyxis TaxID=2614943 RepID=UPI0012E3F349|nr:MULTISPECIES: hypothetical protein [unclassified Sphingopyxis]
MTDQNIENVHWSEASLILGTSGFEMYVQSFRDGSALTIKGNGLERKLYCEKVESPNSSFDETDGKAIFYDNWIFSRKDVESSGLFHGISAKDLIILYFKERDILSSSRINAKAKRISNVSFI